MLLECTSRPDPHHVAGTKATSSEASLSSCIMVVLVGGELLPQDWSWKGSAWPTFGPMLPEPSTRLGRWNTPVGPHWVTAQPLSSMAEKAGTWRIDLRSGNGFLEEGQLCGWQKTCINTHTPRWQEWLVLPQLLGSLPSPGALRGAGSPGFPVRVTGVAAVPCFLQWAGLLCLQETQGLRLEMVHEAYTSGWGEQQRSHF